MKTRFHQITLSKNASHLEQREALFAKELADRQKEDADSIDAHKKARSVTESLQRSRQLMQLEIERVATAGEAFREGASTLTKAVDKHKEINMTAKQADDLLKAMARRDRMDKLIIGAAFAFFICCILYVVAKRLRNSVRFFALAICCVAALLYSAKDRLLRLFSLL